MRKSRSSGKIAVSPRLSSRADSRSVPNGFSTTSRRVADEVRSCELFGDLEERRRRRRDVVDGRARVAERVAQPVVDRAVLGVTADVRQPAQELGDHLLVDRVLRRGDRVANVLRELVLAQRDDARLR